MLFRSAGGENIDEVISNGKEQLAKYNKVLKSEGSDRTELLCETVIFEHKKKLIAAKDKNNIEAIIEVLLSLRVNALQISSELRKNFIGEIIRNDIFCTGEKNDKFLLDLLSISSKPLKNALYSIISVVVSTFKGIQYLVGNGYIIFQRIIDVF